MNVRCHSSVSPRTSKRIDIGRVGSIISRVPSFEDRAPIPLPKQRSSSKKNKHTSSTAICNDTPGNAAHHSKKLTKHNKKMNRRQLGQIASHPLEMDTTKSHNDNLFKIARLQIGDGVWIKRSNFIWKYAVLKRREFITTTNKRKNEDDVCGCWLVFTVNERGCIKKIPIGKVGKWVKTLADDYDEMIGSSCISRSNYSHDSCSKNDTSTQTKNKKKVIEKNVKQKSFAKSSIKSCIRRRTDDRDIRRKEQRSVKFAQYIFADKQQHNISLRSEQGVDEYKEKEELIGARISQNNTGREKKFMNKEQVNSESNNYDTIDGSDIMDANPCPTNEEKEELMKKWKCHLSIDGTIDSSNTFWDDDDENEMMLKGKPVVLEDHEVSMYTLKSSEMVILQDHEVSMHALLGDEDHISTMVVMEGTARMMAKSKISWNVHGLSLFEMAEWMNSNLLLQT